MVRSILKRRVKDPTYESTNSVQQSYPNEPENVPTSQPAGYVDPVWNSIYPTHLPISHSHPYQTFPGPQQISPFVQADLTSQLRGGNQQPTPMWNQGAALCDRIQDRMNTMITAMDEDREIPEFCVEEEPLGETEDNRDLTLKPRGRGIQRPKPKKTLASTYFSKVWLYSNSRLPPHLPPFKVYVPTYPLLCLAARYSLSAYSSQFPKQAGIEDHGSIVAPIHIPASIRLGTKSMILAMQALDTSNTIALAIRGSANFVDWAVNLRPAPESPTGFLDDPGNFVHKGFLAVAKAMISPVAARLKTIVQEDPHRTKSASLLLTGHSAGGAIASLLFCHMLSQTTAVKSELKDLIGLFRRVHCVTFGAPPVSLLPLTKPVVGKAVASETKRWNKSLFFAFINEGDPVVRADPAIVRSLLTLYASPDPTHSTPFQPPYWQIPATALSNGGRLIVLRPRRRSQRPTGTRVLGLKGSNQRTASAIAEPEDSIEALVTDDEQLRTVIYGDPLMHSMKLYASRIEMLAVDAVTGKCAT